MDIRKWLEETEQPEAPRETLRRKHPRRRSKSDSSFLEPLPPRTHSPRQETRDKSVSEVPYPTSSDCSNDSQYARKPRRKTRPDRYEPSSRVHRGRKDEGKKAQRRAKRKKNGKPGEVIQNFKAKNVSGDRLTVRCSCSSQEACARRCVLKIITVEATGTGLVQQGEDIDNS